MNPVESAEILPARRMSVERVYENLGRACRRLLDEACEHWRHGGLVRGHYVETRYDFPGRSRLVLETTRGTVVQAEISDDEIRMGGVASFRYWLATVEEGLLREAGLPRDWLHITGRGGGGVAPPQMTATEILARQRQYQEAFRDPKDKAAEQKAKDLFVAVAGKEAVEKLEAGAHVRVRGSVGGVYRLYKRASFCVEREKDDTKLCAVVPGVPLWDHLLGIKLMIEHDEPRFLKTGERRASGQRSLG